MIPSVVTAEFVAEPGSNLDTIVSEARNLGRKFEDDLWQAGFEAKINDAALQEVMGEAAAVAFRESSAVLEEKANRAFELSQQRVPVRTGQLKESGRINASPEFDPRGRGSKLRGRDGRFVEMNTRSNPLRYEIRYGDGIGDVRSVVMELGFVHWLSGKFIRRQFLSNSIQDVEG